MEMAMLWAAGACFGGSLYDARKALRGERVEASSIVITMAITAAAYFAGYVVHTVIF